MKKLAVQFIFGIFLSSCSKDKTITPITPIPQTHDTLVHYNPTIKSIIDNYCISCHDQTSTVPLHDSPHIVTIIQSGQLLNAVTSPIGQETPYLHMPPGAKLDSNLIDSLIFWKDDGFPN